MALALRNATSFARRGIDYDNTTVFVINTPSDNTQFQFSFAMCLAAGGTSGGLIDWGDGEKTELTDLVYSDRYFFYLSSASSYSPEIGLHTYAKAGTYVIKVTGDVCSINPYIGTSADSYFNAKLVVRESFKRTNIKPTTTIPCSTTNSVLGKFVNLESVDYSRVYKEGDINTVTGVFNNAAVVVKSLKFPKISYLSASFLKTNTNIQDVSFGNTMQEMFELPVSATSTTLWTFANVPTQVVFHCSDGDIKYVDGAWTKVPC